MILPRLNLTPAECRRTSLLLRSLLDDKSSLVKTFAMQGLFDLAGKQPSLLPEVADLLRTLARTGTAAMRARGRLLLQQMERRNS